MDKDVINNPKLIGKNLKKLRIINEMTIEKASELASLSPATISNAESGKSKMTTMNLRELLKIYDFSLALFVSKIQDEIKDFDLNPERIVQKEEQFLLLDGKRTDGEFSLKLMRPIDELSDESFIQIELDSQKTWPNEFLSIDTKIRGIVQKGEFLIEFDQDENRVQIGEEFMFNGKIPHKYRNFTNQSCVVNLILKRSLI